MIELDVHPARAQLMVDGVVVGRVRDFNQSSHPLWIKPGKHTLEFATSGFQTLRVELDTSQVVRQTLHYPLHKGEGSDTSPILPILPQSPRAE